MNSYKAEVAALKKVQKLQQQEQSKQASVNPTEEITPNQHAGVVNNNSVAEKENNSIHSDESKNTISPPTKKPAGCALRRANTFDQEASFCVEQRKHIAESNVKDCAFNQNSKIIQIIANLDFYSFTFQKAFQTCHAIFLEYAENGCLGTYIDSEKYSTIPMHIFRTIAFELLQGIQELHESGLVHRDIKEDNVVFGEDYNMKLIDLSFAGHSEKEVCGTLKYMAPEIVIMESGCAQPVDSSLSVEERLDRFRKVDTFAAGVVLYRMLTKRHPFTKASRFDHRYMLIYSKSMEQFWDQVPILVTESPSDIHHPPPQQSKYSLRIDTLHLHGQNEQSFKGDHLSVSIPEHQASLSSEVNSVEKKQQTSMHSNHTSGWVSPMSCESHGRRYLSLFSNSIAHGNSNVLQNMNQLDTVDTLIGEEVEEHKDDEGDDIVVDNARLVDEEGEETLENCQGDTLSDSQGYQTELEQLKDLIVRLLAFSVEERLGCKEALHHKFFNNSQSQQQQQQQISRNSVQFASHQELAEFFTPIQQ